jgi:Na+-driven multidrug efflux pump
VTTALDRDIRRLALPALGALVAEPLFLLTDTALVGHLGPVPLAGLGIASAIIQTLVGLLVFLAYATTPLVARRLGAGDTTGAACCSSRSACRRADGSSRCSAQTRRSRPPPTPTSR